MIVLARAFALAVVLVLLSAKNMAAPTDTLDEVIRRLLAHVKADQSAASPSEQSNAAAKPLVEATLHREFAKLAGKFMGATDRDRLIDLHFRVQSTNGIDCPAVLYIRIFATDTGEVTDESLLEITATFHKEANSLLLVLIDGEGRPLATYRWEEESRLIRAGDAAPEWPERLYLREPDKRHFGLLGQTAFREFFGK